MKMMITGEKRMDLLQIAKKKKVLIVAHRGVCSGNIPCNSMPAFKAAVLAGADHGFDMIQTDFVFQCKHFLEETRRRNKE